MRRISQATAIAALLATTAMLSCNFTLAAESDKSMQSANFEDEVKEIVGKCVPGAIFETVTISLPFDPATSPLKAIRARYERLTGPNNPYDYAVLQEVYPAFTEFAQSIKKHESFDNNDFGSFFDLLQAPQLKAKGLSDAEIERFRKFGLFCARVDPLMETERKGRAFFTVDIPDIFKSDEDLDAFIAKIKEQFPKAAEQLAAKAQEHQAVAVIKQSSDPRRLGDLEGELALHGLKIIDRSSSSQKYHFDTEQEAESFFKDNNIEKSQIISTFDNEAAVDATIEWPAQASTSTRMLGLDNEHLLLSHLIPRSLVKQVGPKHYQITTPAYVRTIVHRSYLLIAKDPQGAVSAANDPAALLIRMQTDGANYNVTNEMIADKVRTWDKLYGVKVTKASRDAFTVQFSRLPDDLSPLCSEFYMLCGEMLQQGDEEEQAAEMRKMAATLRKTKEMSFWWD